jgi:ketosteroid isomerase-like protein
MERQRMVHVTRGFLGSVLVAGLLVAGCGPSQPAETTQAASQGSDTMGSTSSTTEVLDRHMQTFGAQDMEGTLADYAADAVMFTPQGPVKGTEALRSTFATLFAEWSKPGVTFDLKQKTVDGEHAYIFWDAVTADNTYEAGMDAFVVENGKIVAHFFSAKITPRTAAAR